MSPPVFTVIGCDVFGRGDSIRGIGVVCMRPSFPDASPGMDAMMSEAIDAAKD